MPISAAPDRRKNRNAIQRYVRFVRIDQHHIPGLAGFVVGAFANPRGSRPANRNRPGLRLQDPFREGSAPLAKRLHAGTGQRVQTVRFVRGDCRISVVFRLSSKDGSTPSVAFAMRSQEVLVGGAQSSRLDKDTGTMSSVSASGKCRPSRMNAATPQHDHPAITELLV